MQTQVNSVYARCGHMTSSCFYLLKKIICIYYFVILISQVIAKGPGLEKTGVVINKWAEFTVDTRSAGKATLNIQCMDVDYKAVEVQVKDNRDGTYSCRYMATRSVKHTISITYGKVAVANSPFRVHYHQIISCTVLKINAYILNISIRIFNFLKFWFVSKYLQCILSIRRTD